MQRYDNKNPLERNWDEKEKTNFIVQNILLSELRQNFSA